MLKQGQTLYPLSNIRDMMEIENNVPQSVEMHIETLSKHDILIKLFMKNKMFILFLDGKGDESNL